MTPKQMEKLKLIVEPLRAAFKLANAGKEPQQIFITKQQREDLEDEEKHVCVYPLEVEGSIEILESKKGGQGGVRK